MRYAWIMFGAVTILAPPAAGLPVTWEFAGEIVGLNDVNDLFGGSVTVGSPFSGYFTFESTTPGNSVYLDAIRDISGNVGSVAFRGPVGSFNNISVRDDDALGGFDDYFVLVEVDLLGERSMLSLALRENTGTMFSSNDLPIIPPPLDGLDPDFTGFRIGTSSEEYSIIGDMTSLVPETGTLVLAVVGGLGLTRRRRKRTTH